VGLIACGIGSIFLTPFLPLPDALAKIAQAIGPLFWFAAKTGAILFLFIWVRGTLPRFRFDQLMRFTWLFLFPLAIFNLMLTGLAVALWK